MPPQMDPRFFQTLSAQPQAPQGGGGTPQMDEGSFQALPSMDEGSFQPLSGSAPSAQASASNPHSLFHGHTDNDADYHAPGESTGQYLLKEGNGLIAGAGRGIFETLSGANDILDKHMPGNSNEPGRAAVRDTLHDLAAQHDNTMSSGVGYGGETLMEFLGGDELLKAAGKAADVPALLDKMSTEWKVVSGNPKLLSALKLGAAALKNGANLSPEEAAVLKSHPNIAAFFHIGQEAARAGAVQGTQTAVRTGGDLKQAALEGGAAAATAGVLHGVTKGAGHVLAKGRQAADTIEEMTARGAAAPSADDVKNQFKNTVEGAFSKEQGTLQNQLDDATSTIQMHGQGAPSQQSLTQFAQDKAQSARKKLSDEYVQGLKDLEEHISPDPENPVSIPYEGSPLHEAAKGLQAEGITNEGPLDKALQKTRPGSPRANRTIDILVDPTAEEGGEEEEGGGGAHGLLDEFISNGESAPEAGEAAAPGEGEGGEEGEGTPITLKHLTEYRRVLGERMRDLGFTSADDNADRKIYQRLIQGVDDTIAHMADTATHEGADAAAEGAEGLDHEGDGFEPEEGDEDAPLTAPGASGTKARQILDQMNSKYKNGIRPFQNADVKMLLRGNQNDVVKKLVSGQTSIDDINAVRKVIGPSGVKTLGDASIQNMINGSVDEHGDLDYKKLFKQWQNIKDPNVRRAMFGDTGDALSKALQSATAASNGLDEIGKTMQTLLGNGDVDSAVKHVDQIRKLSNVIGPDGMKTLGQSMLEREIGNASRRLDPATGNYVTDRFDPDKVLEWWNSFKDQPEVRDMLFHPDPETKKVYADTMQRLAQASSVKKLVKYGLLPVTVGSAGVISHGMLPALVAAVAGLGDIGSEHFGRSKSILDHIANNPRTWKLVGGIGGKAEAVANSAVVKKGSQASFNIMKSAASSLGGNDTTPSKSNSDYTGDTENPK